MISLKYMLVNYFVFAVNVYDFPYSTSVLPCHYHPRDTSYSYSLTYHRPYTVRTLKSLKRTTKIVQITHFGRKIIEYQLCLILSCILYHKKASSGNTVAFLITLFI